MILLKNCLFSCLAILATISFAFAQTQTSTFKNSKTSQSSFGQKKSSSDWQLNLNLINHQYTSAIDTTSETTQATQFQAQINSKIQSPRADYKVDLTLANYLERSSTSWVVHDLYAEFYAFKKQSSITVGRQQQSWSYADQFWNLSQWEPAFAHEPLRPERQGMTGLFTKAKTGSFEWIAFVSPLFVPHMGPDVAEENGSITSKSRWYRQTPEQFQFNNEQGVIVYDLDLSDSQDLIQNPSYALSSRYEYQNLWSQLSVGYKPVNKLTLKYRSALNTAPSELKRSQVTVVPSLTYHQIRSFDFGFQWKKSQFVFSAIQDQPEKQTPDAGWIEQNYSPSQVLSAVWSFQTQILNQNPTQFSVGSFRVNGYQVEDLNSDGVTESEPLISSRYDFTNASMVEVAHTGKLFQKRSIASAQWLYDWDQQGAVVNTEWQYFPDLNWSMKLGADILSVKDEKNPARPDGFLNSFRANDRVYAGLNYVF